MVRRALLIGLFIFMLAMSACGSGDEDDGPSLEAGKTRTTAVAAASPVVGASDSPLSALPTTVQPSDTVILPALDGLSGQVYVMGGNNRSGVLVQADFNGQPAEVLVQNVNNAAGVSLAPDGKRFSITGNRGEDPRNATVWTIDAGGIQAVVELDGSGAVIGWSPDSSQMVVAGQNILLVGVDGSITPIPSVFGLAEVAWTTEGDILIGMHDFRSGALMQVLRPAEPEPEVVLTNDPDGAQWSSLLDVPLTDYSLAAGYRFFNRARVFADGSVVQIPNPPDRSATGLCDTWTVNYGPQGAAEPVLALEDTHALDAGAQLPDGSLVVVRYYKPTCSISENVMAELWQVGRDGSSSVMVTGFPIGATTITGYFDTPPLYTLSPDGRYALWVGQVNNTTALVMKDLEADVERVLTVVEGIYGVVWVAE